MKDKAFLNRDLLKSIVTHRLVCVCVCVCVSPESSKSAYTSNDLEL